VAGQIDPGVPLRDEVLPIFKMDAMGTAQHHGKGCGMRFMTEDTSSPPRGVLMAIFVDKERLSKRNLEVERVDTWKEPFHTLFINKMEAEYTESTASKSAVYARLAIRFQHGNSTSKSDFNLCFAGTHLKTQDDVRHSQAKRITSFLTNSRFDARNLRADCDAAVFNGAFNPRKGREMRDCDPKTKACMGKIYDDSNCAEMLTPNGKGFIDYDHLLEVAKARDEITTLWRGWHMKGAIAPESLILDGDWKEIPINFLPTFTRPVRREKPTKIDECYYKPKRQATNKTKLETPREDLADHMLCEAEEENVDNFGYNMEAACAAGECYLVGSRKKSKRMKCPQYCDRVLVWPGSVCRAGLYSSVPHITASDHTPVYAILQLEIPQRDKIRSRRIERLMKNLTNRLKSVRLDRLKSAISSVKPNSDSSRP